jgi:hypothetical protein
MSLDQESRTLDLSLPTPAWDGDKLIDVATGRTMNDDGTVSSRGFYTPFAFDRALSVRSGDVLWSAVWQNRGTKALLFKNWRVHRELNRSYYCADDYDYPLALTRIHDGRVVVAHCPNSYDVVELEDAESGGTLWTRKTEKMEFHSRLSFSENGEWLLSAGWFWHPVDGAWLCKVDISNPASDSEIDFSFGAQIDGAAFLDNDHLVVSSTEDVINEETPATGIGPMQLGVWSIPEQKWVSMVPIDTVTGTIMPWRSWLISFYEHPKAIELSTGKVVRVWKEIESGRQIGSIELGSPKPPAIAMNPQYGRFAVCGEKKVHVISLSQFHAR